MKAIHPSLFSQVMRFPDNVRTDFLEFLGATAVEYAQLNQMIVDVTERLDKMPSGDNVTEMWP